MPDHLLRHRQEPRTILDAPQFVLHLLPIAFSLCR
jgi:hypothetical protein